MRLLSILAKVIGGILVLFFLLVMFVRSPWGQNIIKDQVLSYLTKKTNTTITLDRIYISFNGNVNVEGLYVEDQSRDTLIYSRKLTADIPIWPILTGGGIAVDELNWDGVHANIYRDSEEKGFNYQFLMDAFISADTVESVSTETDTSTINFKIGEIVLSHINANYIDHVAGMTAKLNLGKFTVEIDKTDIAEMKFVVGSAKLQDTRFSYIQTKPFPESADTTETILPILSLGDIQIANVRGLYQSDPDGIKAEVDLENFSLNAPVVDLSENKIGISDLALDESRINIQLNQVNTPDTAGIQTVSSGEISPFTWPDWQISLDNISLKENEILYQVNDAEPVPGQFNPAAISLDKFTLNGENFYLINNSTGGHLNELHFLEGSGISVDQFQFQLKMDDQNINLSGLKMKALNSSLQGDLSAQYSSVESLINEPEKARLDLDLSGITVDLDEFYRFQPDLRNNTYFQILTKKPITGNLIVRGPISSLRIRDAGIQWGSQTAIFASGYLYHPTMPDRLRFNFPKILIRSEREDLNLFMNEDSLGIMYPDEARLTAQLTGNLDDFSTEAVLESTLGQMNLKGNIKYGDSLAFASDIKIINVQLDTLLQNPQLGPLSLTLTATGQGSDINTLNGTVKATIDSFYYNEYPVRNLVIEGDIVEGSGGIESKYRDSNLNLAIEADIVLDSTAPEVDASINLLGADLAALGIMDKKIKMAFQLNAGFKGNSTSFTSTASIKEGQVVFEEKSYPLGRMELNAHVTPDTTAGSIHSRMMDLTLQSNTSPTGFVNAISRYIDSYLIDTIQMKDSTSNDVQVLVSASLREDPLLNKVFLPGLKEMDTMRLKIDFHEKEKNLMALIDVPYLNYSGIEIDSLGFSADSDPDHFNLEMGLREIVAGPLTINRTYFSNEVRDQILYSHFEAKYNDSELIHFKTETSRLHDSLRIHFDPSDLVFDARDWVIPSMNQILIGENKIEFKNFRIQSGEQKLTIDDNPGEKEFNAYFQQFNIANIIGYFNPDTLLATGALNGQITLEEPWGDAGLIADLKINDLHVMQVDMGIMSLYSVTEDAQNYQANLNLQGGEVDLSAKGEYHGTENDSDVSLDMSIDRISMNAVESFSMGSVENSSGYISGEMKANGSMTNLQYDGRLIFNEASLTPSILQTPFNLGSQDIIFNNDGIELNKFTITDEDGNHFLINGDILTSDILNPSFDLTMEAKDFQILNATEKDNDLFYGQASFDANATLTGDLNLPILDLQLNVSKGTNVTYIMPQGEAALNKREGIVEFVNKENPDDILSEKEEENLVIKGYDVNAVVSVSKEATFKVIISEETGDHFQIAGDGDLNFTIDPVGRISLSGIYTLQDGHYEMNLYNLVNRRFDIAEGSTVSWSGDPFDAKLDVRAIYEIETSSSALMASQTSGADPSVQNQYRRKLPFLIYLNVDGQLSEPKLTFDLDMPEDARGEAGGQIYGRIQQINQQEQMLNKQVFSLLVLGRFYPDSGSDGSSGGIVNVARDNLNQALSDQLNLFSDKLLGDTGLELNFGLDSYTDYQGQNAQNRTELDIAAQKKFLNDRLVVKVGSEVDIEGGNTNPQEENPLIGNVSVEYLLTENGQFRIRGFRKNVFENVIDGQTIVSGLALIFTREFNKFDELWKPMASDKKDGVKEELNQE